MANPFITDTAVPFPSHHLIADKALSPDFHITDIFSRRESAADLIQKPYVCGAAHRPHSLRWLDVPPHGPLVRFPSIVSATTVSSSLHQADDAKPVDTALAGDLEADFPLEDDHDHDRMSRRYSCLPAPPSAVRRLVSGRQSVDLPPLDSAPSLPSSPITPITPDTPFFASDPGVADFTTAPFLNTKIGLPFSQGNSSYSSSSLGKCPPEDKPKIKLATVRRKSRDLRLEQSPPHGFDPSVNLTLSQLQRAQNLDVLDAQGHKVRFGSLWQAQPTCVIFIRHFWCPSCTDYVRSITEEVDLEILDEVGVKFVIISNGAPAMIKSYSSIFNLPFPLYTDPSRALYRTLGMTLCTTDGGPDSQRGDYIRHGVASGIGMIMKNALKVRMPLHKNGGDSKQLGGEFVLGPGLRCSYVSRMHNTRSHKPVRDVLLAAGIQLDTHPEGRTGMFYDREEQWMRDRDAELKRMRARKGRRRGFLGEHRRSNSTDYDNGTLEAWSHPHHGDGGFDYGTPEHPGDSDTG